MRRRRDTGRGRRRDVLCIVEGEDAKNDRMKFGIRRREREEERDSEEGRRRGKTGGQREEKRRRAKTT